jgi:hypothetical protein
MRGEFVFKSKPIVMAYKKQAVAIASIVIAIICSQCIKGGIAHGDHSSDPVVRDGKKIFRFDTFGDEDFWSGLLHIDKAIAGAAHGGFGDGISPKAALGVGLKVDAEALPADVVAGIKSGAISLDDPKSTLALLKLNSVVGVKGTFGEGGELKAIGITCAICHSTVDDSFQPGVGRRLDGWPNRDLNVGAIISLTDNAQPIADMLHVDEATLRKVLGDWGPGRFPAILFMDGKAYRPDGKIAANLIPAAFGLRGIELTTYTGWGDISYWNSFVGNLEMHGKGNFSDPRLNNPDKYPIAVEQGFYNVTNDPDLITSKLPALRAYQHSIEAPRPPHGSFSKSAAARGAVLFFSKAKCGTCHPAPLYADNELHSADELGIDDFEASRSPTGKYRTTPLGGLFAREKGGFYHDGQFADLAELVNHYDEHLETHLSGSEKQDLIQFLKSL